MKLLTKTQIYYSSLLLVLLAIWSGVFLYAISLVIEESIDETLLSEQITMVKLVQTDSLGSFPAYAKNNPLIDYTYIDSVRPNTFTYSDTTLYDLVEEEWVPYRQIHTEISLSGRPVRVTLRKSTIEYDDLFTTILITELIFMIVLVIGTYWLNRSIMERVWQPFFATLKTASEYRLTGDASLDLSDSTIEEFDKLNKVLKQMTQKMKRDYQSLKQFTENASHEIQTPLSIITTRIEILIQDENFTKIQWNSLLDLHQAASRLSRLNRALLLLTKIENRQFTEHEPVNAGPMITGLLNEYGDEINRRNLDLSKEIREEIILTANPELIELLLRNLISNAVKHNIKGGVLHVSLSSNSLIIANHGRPPQEDTGSYFERFHKGDSSSSSLGLGLAIVHAICEMYDYRITYTYEHKVHSLEINFSSAFTASR